jgi:hypothetical protein
VARYDPGPQRPATEILRVHEVAIPGVEPSRVHLDLRLPGSDPWHLLAAGARIVRPPDADPWFVLADPEDNEFCAFPSVDQRPAGIFELVVKCRDAHWLARWWAEALGGRVADEADAAVVVGAPDFPWDFMVFDPVPEPKAGKNCLHWHVLLRDSDPAALCAMGATLLQTPAAGRDWWVLADPEGNEFCAQSNAR